MSDDGCRIEILEAQDRGAFCSGVDALDRSFRGRVTPDVQRRVSNCFVLLDAENQVAGYYTFAAAGIPLVDLPESRIKRLPRYPSLPARLTGRLAVERRDQRQGLGALLVVDAVARAIWPEPAIDAIVVDAKDDQAAAFYVHQRFHRFTSQSNRLVLPVSEIAKRLSGQET